MNASWYFDLRGMGMGWGWAGESLGSPGEVIIWLSKPGSEEWYLDAQAAAAFSTQPESINNRCPPNISSEPELRQTHNQGLHGRKPGQRVRPAPDRSADSKTTFQRKTYC